MSRSSDQSSSAASMIRRFREGKPTSKQDRESARGNENNNNNRSADKEMWWVEKENQSTDEYQPRTAPRALKQTTSRKQNEILEQLRRPADNNNSSANRRSSMDRSDNVDDMMESEIRGLEKEMREERRRGGGHSEERRNPSDQRDQRGSGRISFEDRRRPSDHRGSGRFDRGSFENFDPKESLKLSDYEPTYRYSGDGRGYVKGGEDQGRRREQDRDSGRLSGGSDYLRSSVETLGNSGYRGLLDQSLKLGFEESKNEKFVFSGMKPDGEPVVGNMQELNKSLEELLYSLKKMMF